MGNRYFTFELMGFTSDNFDYVGQRTTGSTGGGLRDLRAGLARGPAVRGAGDAAGAHPVGAAAGPHPGRR